MNYQGIIVCAMCAGFICVILSVGAGIDMAWYWWGFLGFGLGCLGSVGGAR